MPLWSHASVRDMARLIFRLAFAAATAAQSSSGFAGIWSLNRSLSEFPKELGFNAGFIPPPDAGQRRPSTPVVPRRESYEDSQRVRLFTEEVRNPPSRLTIVDNAAAIIITNDLGQ